MPHINLNISKKLESSTKDTLQKEIAGIMTLIPGKNAANTLICIIDNCTMYRDYEPLEAVFADIRLLKDSPEESKAAFAEALFKVIESVLIIPPAHVQMNFIPLPNWASGGVYR